MLIEPLARSFEGGSIIPLKEQLGDKVSFGEIRLVLASMDSFKDKTVVGNKEQ